ncbi:unnamed protein product [Lactuca virosa]|uniref:1-phosphatidylinositol 4-kinase n=1 Tax=Lactuca virosa TaxID=75947 RepID=A0AAU9MWL1_9ASTR|nr:unnamed protein product [Lactuca virosa]
MELTHLVQTHILEIRTIPEALPYFVTPKVVDEDSPLLQQLTHWAACLITQALEYFTPTYKGHPRVMAYIMRVLKAYPPSRVTFFMLHLIQALRYDDEKLVEGYLIRVAQRSDVFSHILIWHLQIKWGKKVCQRRIQPFWVYCLLLDNTSSMVSVQKLVTYIKESDVYIRCTLSSSKRRKKSGHKEVAPCKIVKGIKVNSGIPLQSAAKVPIMITFDVADRNGVPNDLKPQACILKVGDDCRQDVLALRVISLLKDIFEAVGLDLYLFPYGVLPTDPERRIIEVVQKTWSRSQMGETTDGDLYKIFQQDFGAVGSPSFEAARHNFIISGAGYAVASLLLQPKDTHNGNLSSSWKHVEKRVDIG